jgi:4-diphosphocytidyl-2-C-methyl-D-erythritol kinase
MLLFANAKINLGLNIICKRGDGYHLLQSIFIPIPFYDIIEITPANNNDINFTSTGIAIDSSIEENLCVKAYRLMQNLFNIGGINLHLHKQIPIGSGLGGGSSDAAFTLKGINKLEKLNLSNEELKKIAVKLGADCPFFIDNVPAYAEGIGEQLKPIDNVISDNYIVLVIPDIFISSTEAYKNIIPQTPDYNLLEVYLSGYKQYKNTIKNQFEKFAFSKYQQLKEIKDSLYKERAFYASMSGSGSAMYGLFDFEPPENIIQQYNCIKIKMSEESFIK